MQPQGRTTEAIRTRNKAVVRRMLEAFNTTDTKVVGELLHTAAVSRSGHHVVQAMNTMAPMPRVQQEITHGNQAFPDRHFEEVSMVAEGDLVILRWRMTGTHKGPLFDRPPTGKQISVTGLEVVRLKDGKIIEHEDDNAATLSGVLMQLGWHDLLPQSK